MCFNMIANMQKGCSENYFNLMGEDISIITSPAQDEQIVNKAQWSLNGLNRTVDVCYDIKDLEKFDSNRPIDLIFTAYWWVLGRSSDAISSKAYMSVVYELFIMDEVVADLEVNTRKPSEGETVIFDASQSYFARSKLTTGLLYRWTCPRKVQTHCDKFLYQSKLEISPDTFEKYLSFANLEFRFSVEVWPMASGD